MIKERGGATPKKTARQRDAEIESERQRLKFELINRVVTGAFVVLGIAALWISLQPVIEITNKLAGRTTSVSLVVGITFGLTIVTSIGWSITGAQSHSRKKELERLRERQMSLEAAVLPSHVAEDAAAGGAT